MQKEWWDSSACCLCNYGWLLLPVIVLAFAAYLLKDSWLPILGLEPDKNLADVTVIQAFNENYSGSNTVYMAVSHVVEGPSVQVSGGFHTSDNARVTIRLPGNSRNKVKF